jgi:hypothetical protein
MVPHHLKPGRRAKLIPAAEHDPVRDEAREAVAERMALTRDPQKTTYELMTYQIKRYINSCDMQRSEVICSDLGLCGRGPRVSTEP